MAGAGGALASGAQDARSERPAESYPVRLGQDPPNRRMGSCFSRRRTADGSYSSLRRPPNELLQPPPNLRRAALAGLDLGAVLEPEHQHAVLAAIGVDRAHVHQHRAVDAEELSFGQA